MKDDKINMNYTSSLFVLYRFECINYAMYYVLFNLKKNL